MKVGILCPRSNAHPAIMMDFMNGIKGLLKLRQLDNAIQLISESIGFGGNEKEVYEKAEKLLVLDDADILVAYIDLRVLQILKPLIYASGKLILIVNPGANYPQNVVPQPNVLNLTLQHGFLCWLSGKLAAQLKKVDAVMATTFYDCGYLHSAAIVNGFVQSAGKIRFNYINNQRYDDAFEIKELKDYLSSDKNTEILLCVFDSLPACMFYQQLNNFSEAEKLHLYVSPMMLEQKALENAGERFKFSIEGFVPWQRSLENSANHEFLESYLQQTKKPANIFSLLGWETGLILKEILHTDGDFANGEEIRNRLAEAQIWSPRGEMKLDAETNYFVAPAYKCSFPQNGGEVIIEQVNEIEKEWVNFISYPSEGVSSGWTNTYLCY